MDRLAILVPVLGRPHRVAPLLAAFAQTTSVSHSIYFIPDLDDSEEIKAIEAAGGDILYLSFKEGYATKINRAIKLTTEPLIMSAADDLEAQPGWAEAAIAKLDDTIEVVGLNDLMVRSRANWATHFVFTRQYANEPILTGEEGPLCELYDHSCVDDEFAATAKQRGVYVYAEDAHVKHFHPDNDTAPRDETYNKGRKHLRSDKRLWRSRRFWYIENEHTATL